MDFLEDLTIKKCCICIELKTGCFIIAIASLIILVPGASGALTAECYSSTAPVRTVQAMGAFMFLVALFAGLFFIYGLWAEVRLPTMTYMVVSLIAMVFTFVAGVMVLGFAIPKDKENCVEPFPLAGSAIIEMAVQFYCFVVVNSYRVLVE